MFTEQNIDKSLQHRYYSNTYSPFPFTRIQIMINDCDYLLYKSFRAGSWCEQEVNHSFEFKHLVEVLKTLNVYKIKKIQIKNNEFKLCFWCKVDYDTTKELIQLEQLAEYWEKER